MSRRGPTGSTLSMTSSTSSNNRRQITMRSTGRPTTVTLPTDKPILIEREFHAPARLVYRAFTEPELVRRWWHARRGEVTLVEIDLRVGGRWRYVMLTRHGMRV